MNPNIVALVPMRHSSERVPGKNYRNFAGRPLYHYIISSLLSCPAIKKVLVDTDSSIIKDGLADNYPEVVVIDRPEHLRAGTIPINDVLLHDVVQMDADYYLQTHSTNPLLHTKTINKAIQFFLENRPMHDSLFSVTAIQTRLWDGLARPINHNSAILLRTQDLPPVYEENSCIYIFSRKILESRHNRIGERPLMFCINREEALDIDEEFDFKLAEIIQLERNNNNKIQV
jgi:CMP-N-acetylneuraminic acid synthetase